MAYSTKSLLLISLLISALITSYQTHATYDPRVAGLVAIGGLLGAGSIYNFCNEKNKGFILFKDFSLPLPLPSVASESIRNDKLT